MVTANKNMILLFITVDLPPDTYMDTKALYRDGRRNLFKIFK